MLPDRNESFETRLLEATRNAANLGIALRDLHRDFPEAFSQEDLLDLAASILADGFAAPKHVKEIHVRLGVLQETLPEMPVMAKPATVQ